MTPSPQPVLLRGVEESTSTSTTDLDTPRPLSSWLTDAGQCAAAVTSAEAAHGHPHGFRESLRQLHTDSPEVSFSPRAMGLLGRYASIAYREEWDRIGVTLEGSTGAVFAHAATVGAATYWAALDAGRDAQIADASVGVVNVVPASSRA